MTFTVSAPSAEHLRSLVSGLDAMLTGRRTFDKAHGWDGNHAWGPAFVLTRQIPDGWPRPNPTVIAGVGVTHLRYPVRKA
jgi:hypothetical protein